MTKYTITAAQYSNAARTAAVITTTEAGAVLISTDDVDLWALMLAAGTPDEVSGEGAPADEAVPAFVTQRQARLALHHAGLLDAVDTAIAALPADQGTAARIEWDYAVTVERASPTVATLAAALGLTDAELDALFVAAGRL